MSFLGKTIDNSEIDRITELIERETRNIILIGMPGCGKSTVASELARLTGRRVVDTDSMIVEAEKRSIPEIFENEGESYFRAAESRAAREAGKMSGAIIATGGGIVTVCENFDSLRQNGRVFFIKRELESLSRDGRPLSIDADLGAMYEKRLPMYERFCDHTVENNSSVTRCAERILELF